MAIKGRKKPTQTGNSDEQIQLSGPSISDLPMTTFVDILLKLSTKSIVLCKCVCKTWRNIISDPQFAKLHLAQAKICLLIRDVHFLRLSRALYLLEPEDGYCWCKSVDNECDHCRLKIKVKSKLKIPMRNAQVMFRHAADDANVIFHTKSKRKWKHLIELNSRMDYMYKIVNSCNGLLCLTEPSGGHSVVVCNPITGEFIHLPQSCNGGTDESDVIVGLGFSPKNNQYKVIRMFPQWMKDPIMGSHKRCYKMVEIYTLGTDSWRSVDISGLKICLLHSLTYLNGACHWLLHENSKDSFCIVSFDFDAEQFHFHYVSSPPCEHRTSYRWAMGAVGGYLCLYSFAYDRTCIWVMKHYGLWESWTKSFSVDFGNDHWLCGSCLYRPTIYFSNGALLLIGHDKLIYFDQLRGQRFKYLKFRGIASNFEVIAHTPSFISLKDIVKTDKVEVLNVNSRCGKLKLVEETYPLFLEGTKK